MNKILEKVGEEYRLIIRTEYHAQVMVEDRVYHNFWPMRDGRLKVQYAGSRGTHVYSFMSESIGKLIRKLKGYNYQSDSDVARMKEIQRLIGLARLAHPGHGDINRDGIYCDAGWKEGLAKLSAVRIDGDDVDIIVRKVLGIESSQMAEEKAISLAIAHFGATGAVIYSDCQQAVNKFRESGESGIEFRWIKRSQNELADSLGNIRD